MKRDLTNLDLLLGFAGLSCGVGLAAASFVATTWMHFFDDFGGSIPLFTRVVLTPAFCLSACVVPLGATLAGTIRRRRAWVVVGLLLGTLAGLAFWLGLKVPLWQMSVDVS